MVLAVQQKLTVEYFVSHPLNDMGLTIVHLKNFTSDLQLTRGSSVSSAS